MNYLQAPAGVVVTVQFYLSSNCVNNNGIWSCPNINLPAQTYQTDVTGSVVVQVNTGNYDYLSIQASSPISDGGYFGASKQPNPFVNLLTATVLTKEWELTNLQPFKLTDVSFRRPRIGSPLQIQVTTSDCSLEKVFYHVIAKGIMLESKALSLKDKSAILKFTPDFRYSYQTNIVFFYYDEFGKIVSAQVYLSLLNDLPNFVSNQTIWSIECLTEWSHQQLNLDLAVNTTEPGKNVSLCVSSAINSTASLSAIDQSELSVTKVSGVLFSSHFCLERCFVAGKRPGLGEVWHHLLDVEIWIHWIDRLQCAARRTPVGVSGLRCHEVCSARISAACDDINTETNKAE